MNVRPNTKRPILVWVISIFYVLTAGSSLLSSYLVLSGSIPLSPGQKAYFDSITTLDLMLSILLCLANFIGAVCLFLLRRPAFYLLTGAWLLGILMMIWHSLSKGWIAAMGALGTVGTFIGLGISAVICLYNWRLLKNGVLR